METVILNGFYMTSQEKAHQQINKRLRLENEPADGASLLASLTEYPTSVQVIFFNEDEMKRNLGGYGEELLDVFRRAAAANHRLSVVFDD